jgi:hypothetical protein
MGSPSPGPRRVVEFIACAGGSGNRPISPKPMAGRADIEFAGRMRTRIRPPEHGLVPSGTLSAP